MAKRMIIITVPVGADISKDAKNRPIFKFDNDDYLPLPKLNNLTLPKMDNFNGSAIKGENLPCYSVLGPNKVGAQTTLVDQDYHFGAYVRSRPLTSRADSYTSSAGGESGEDEEFDEMGEAEESDGVSDYRTVPVRRKRQRLTHLTPEEKLKRRKLKNRAAAHAARERRKMFMCDLEREYRRLRFENDGLKSRNTQIKQDIQKLTEENEALKKKAAAAKCEDQPQIVCQPASATGNVIGPAAFINGPQQQARTSPAASAVVGVQTLLGWLLTLTASMLASSDCCANSSPSMDDVFGQHKWPLVLSKISQMKLDDQSKLILTKKMERLKEVWNSQRQQQVHIQQHHQHRYPS